MTPEEDKKAKKAKADAIRLKNLAPKFKKGGAPGPGRPKRTDQEINLIKACKQKTPEALDTITDIMKNGETEKNRLSAALAIIERAYGKPVQQQEIDLSGNITVFRWKS